MHWFNQCLVPRYLLARMCKLDWFATSFSQSILMKLCKIRISDSVMRFNSTAILKKKIAALPQKELVCHFFLPGGPEKS